MVNQTNQKGDVIFPKKEDDGELLPKIPSEISEVGDIIRGDRKKKSDELFSKLEKTFGKINNEELN